jgi:hypothetical protein
LAAASLACGEAQVEREAAEIAVEPLVDSGPILVPLLDFHSATLTLGATSAGAMVRVQLLPGAVVYQNGQLQSFPADWVTLPDIVIGADGAVSVPLDATSFPQGVGALFITKDSSIAASVDVKSSAKATIVDRRELRSMETDTGTQFRIPYVGASNKSVPVSLAITASSASRLVRVRDLQGQFPDTDLTVPTGQTLLWKGSVTGSGTLLVVADGAVGVSAMLTGEGTKPPKVRAYPAPI